MFGFFVVLCLAVLAWPTLPRRYESSATIVLRPTDREGQSDSVQSMRQPLDENAIQSEVDMIGATSVIDTVLAKHGIAADPEFTAPSLIGRVKTWIRPGEGAGVLPARLPDVLARAAADLAARVGVGPARRGAAA